MTIRNRVMAVGAGAGALGAALVVVLSITFERNLGTALGVLAGAAAGAIAAWLTAEVIGRSVVAHLRALDEERRDHSVGQAVVLDLAGLDKALEDLRQALVGASRLQAESEAIERLARTFQPTAPDSHDASRSAPSGSKGCVELHEKLQQFATLLLSHALALEEVNDRMASGAIDQSDAVSRTTTTVEALSEKIDRISQHAEDAAEACEKSRQEACRGLEQVHSVIDGMDRLRTQVEANGRKARRLGDRSLEIGTIVELIRGISSRTDMLALNATIESVRAGEHGQQASPSSPRRFASSPSVPRRPRATSALWSMRSRPTRTRASARWARNRPRWSRNLSASARPGRPSSGSARLPSTPRGWSKGSHARPTTR